MPLTLPSPRKRGEGTSTVSSPDGRHVGDKPKEARQPWVLPDWYGVCSDRAMSLGAVSYRADDLARFREAIDTIRIIDNPAEVRRTIRLSAGSGPSISRFTTLSSSAPLPGSPGEARSSNRWSSRRRPRAEENPQVAPVELQLIDARTFANESSRH